jgi:hypothetical protein
MNIKYESPQCVSAVVRFDESVSKIEWNDSFSFCTWTTETIDLKSPEEVEEEEDSKEHEVRFDESVSKIEWNDSFSSCTSWTEETIDLKSAAGGEEEEKSEEQQNRIRLKQVLQDRLRRLKKEQSQEDVQEEYTELGLRQAKNIYKEMLQQQYGIVKRDKDYLVEESTKNIHYLLQQNAIQRQQIKFLKRGGMEELKVHNQNLQEACRMAAEAQEGMECHLEGLQAMNSQLTENLEIFKSALDKPRRSRFFPWKKIR